MENHARSPHSSPSKFGKSTLQSNGNVAVTKLMQQCTSMLRDKMWNERHRQPQAALRYRDSNGSAQPDNALEAMGPVLESVLGSLTMEYERRLLQKDQEIKACADELNKCRAKIQQLEQRLLEGPEQPQLEYQMTQEQSMEIQRLRNMENEYMQQVRSPGPEHGSPGGSHTYTSHPCMAIHAIRSCSSDAASSSACCGACCDQPQDVRAVLLAGDISCSQAGRCVAD
jgi:hypothetical protein